MSPRVEAARGVGAAPERVALPEGEFRLIPGRPGVVIGVPHGGFEEFTGLIGERLGRLTGAGAVIATGFAGARTGGVRLNVNRPTEGARLPPGAEPLTARARRVHDAYAALVRRAARGPLALYVELHGYTRRASVVHLEVATAGIGPGLARRLKARYRLAWERSLNGRRELPGLDLLIEPVDRVRFRATAARRWPPFREASAVLHIELPPEARLPAAARESSIGLLAELLRVAAAATVGDG